MSLFKYHIAKIADILGARRQIHQVQSGVVYLSVDTRSLPLPSQTLFIALKSRRDGHEYIDEAYLMGVRNFLVADDFRISHLWDDANFLLVPDTLEALQKLVEQHRLQFDIPVVGITGSNGKTIIKEWAWQMMSNDILITKSPKSYNSQIGVPLSVWQLGAKHQLGIFEAGISRVGEMENLQKIIKPTIGILTHIGEMHSEGFESKRQKVEEKLLLFKEVTYFIFSPDNLAEFPDLILPKAQYTTWSFSQKADIQLVSQKIEGAFSTLEIWVDDTKYELKVPFIDHASLDNLLACWALLRVMKYENEDIIGRISHLQPISMRLELKTGIHHCSIIDDSYSADESSLQIALDFLNQQNQHQKKTVILSDFAQSDKSDEDLYRSIAQILRSQNINRLIGIGEKLHTFQSCFGSLPHREFYKDTKHFIEAFQSSKFQQESILIKGARTFMFEKVSKLLTQKVHDTVMEVNLNALVHNLNVYKSKLMPNVKIMVVVKAFSYGSGSFEIANVLQYHKVDYLAVAYADEGISLRQAGIKTPIMVMSPEPFAFDSIIANQLEPEIYNFSILESFLTALPSTQKQYPIHLKIDTGMHRLGFESYQIEDLVQLLKRSEHIKVQSVFSHLSSSDDESLDAYTLEQIAQFKHIAQKIEEELGYTLIKHIVNTSGIMRFPQAHFDMVRLGIGLYGFDTQALDKIGELRPVATLKTTISQIKTIHANERVGYNRKGILPSGGKIATVKIGYADGYSRAFGNGMGAMLINGKLAYTVGNICMDMCMLDITHIDTYEGDEVIIFDEILPIYELAKRIDTIPYEILTNISQRVKRVYFYN